MTARTIDEIESTPPRSPLPGSRRENGIDSGTCPNGTCRHTIWMHDVAEAPGPRIHVCTVFDCSCRGAS